MIRFNRISRLLLGRFFPPEHETFLGNVNRRHKRDKRHGPTHAFLFLSLFSIGFWRPSKKKSSVKLFVSFSIGPRLSNTSVNTKATTLLHVTSLSTSMQAPQ